MNENNTEGEVVLMSQPEAKVILDSISPAGSRLTTLECKFHRMILPEVNTYRKFSRSASSSRAIPLRKRIEEVRFNPAVPFEWGKNQRGMTADGTLDSKKEEEATEVWLDAANLAADQAQRLGDLDVHKQIASRLLEPFLMQTMVISSTDFKNMFTQRIHPGAQPEFRELAIKMQEALKNSDPTEIDYDEWHLPFISDVERFMDISLLRQISTARIARTSYAAHGENNDIEKDLELYVRLAEAVPPHCSPFEAVATPAQQGEEVLGNFRGWHQWRHKSGLDLG